MSRVDDALLVRIAEAAAGLEREARGIPGAEGPVFAEHPAERQTVEQLHRDEEMAAFLVGIVERHDVRVVHSRGGLGFPEKERNRAGMIPKVVRHAFEGHVAAESAVEGPVDLAHAPAADRFDDLVARFGDEGRRARMRGEGLRGRMRVGEFFAQPLDPRGKSRMRGLAASERFEYAECALQVAQFFVQLGKMHLEGRRGFMMGQQFDPPLELLRREVEMAFLFEGEDQQFAGPRVVLVLRADLLQQPNRAPAILALRGQRGGAQEFALGFEGADQSLAIPGLLEGVGRFGPVIERGEEGSRLGPVAGSGMHFRRFEGLPGRFEEAGGAPEIGEGAAEMGRFDDLSGLFEGVGGMPRLPLFLVELGQQHTRHLALSVAFEDAGGIAEVAFEIASDGRGAALEDQAVRGGEVDLELLGFVLGDPKRALDDAVPGADQDAVKAEGKAKPRDPLPRIAQRCRLAGEADADVPGGLRVPADFDFDRHLRGGQAHADRGRLVRFDAEVHLFGDA